MLLFTTNIQMCLCIGVTQESADDSQNPDSSSGGSFKYLLALHVLTAADPGVAAPAADTQRFVRCLAPYASALASIAAPGQQGRTSSGEQQHACASMAGMLLVLTAKQCSLPQLRSCVDVGDLQ